MYKLCSNLVHSSSKPCPGFVQRLFKLCSYFFEMTRVPGKPYQSCLVPYENEIIALRRKKPPVPYSQIAELLCEKYQLRIHRGTIYSFMEIRSKESYKNKFCKHAWNMEFNNTAEIPTLQKSPLLETPKPAITDKPKPAVTLHPEERAFNFPFSETYNLHRVSPEEAAARLKKLEEKEKRR